MTVNCDPNKPPLQEELPTQKVRWSASSKTRLQKLAEIRRTALELQSELYKEVDPIVLRQKELARKAQEYWEKTVMEAGHIRFLSPGRSSNTTAWLANWMGVKVGLAKQVRDPLLNVKRITDGLLREAGVYAMIAKQADLANRLKAIAKEKSIDVRPEDMRRLLEEGMIPQRMAVYGNTPIQTAALEHSYNKMVSDFIERGFSTDEIEELSQLAATVSSQIDEFTAVAKGTGMEIGEMYNLGYLPRQLTQDGFSTAKLAGMVALDTPENVGVALAKSRSTWRYLPEDHSLASKMLGLTEDQLHELIADPVEFAMFLSKRTTPDQLDLLLDSGVMSKIPALTNEVNEFLMRTYKLPLVDVDLFIADPIEAVQRLTHNLRTGLEQSALVKYLNSEGLQSGWVITKELAQQPEYSKYIPLHEIKGLSVAAHGGYVHPFVANQLQGLINITTDPGQMSNVARGWKMYTSWFAKQAIGNPVGAKVYLFNQFMGNMLTAAGQGVGIHEYVASVIDMTRLSMQGLDVFDNVKPFRVVGDETLTHQEFVARTARMFSRDVLPGISGENRLLKWNELSPKYILNQLAQLKAASTNTPEYAGELLRLANRKQDAILTPTIRLASILDMAGHLALLRGRTARVGGPNVFNTVAGLETPKNWEGAINLVKQSFPAFDDVGILPRMVSSVLPFTSWAIQNAPLQLADMMRNPSRWVAISRSRALWNKSQVEDANGDQPLRGEMTPTDLAEYGIILSRDSGDKSTTMLMTTNFDPKWGAMTWLYNTLNPNKDTSSIQKFADDTIARSYFASVYELASGKDLFTGRQRDDSEFSAGEKFIGIPMPAWMAATLSVSPVLASLDRLPVLSGTKDVFDARTGAVLIPATRDWLGGKGELPPSRLEGMEAVIQTMGAKVRYIDGLMNMQYNEAQIKKSIQDIITRQRREQVKLQEDLRRGTLKEGDGEYQRRLDAINRMTSAAIQINYDLARIQKWAVDNKVPSTEQIQEMRRQQIVTDNLPLPGSDFIKNSLDSALELQQQHTGGKK